MKVTGFSFVRNAIKYDYPIVESISSILPLCDDFVVAVGNSDDGTLALIRNISSDKIRIIETVWDDSLREGGRVLALETDKAFQEIKKETDWAFYIQGDEVIHEKYHDEIFQKMKKYCDNTKVDGLLFKYLHFYGSYDYVGASRNWYRNEIRIIRNNKSFYSFRDAQGFRKNNNEKLSVVPIDAYVYHYGWVKEPKAMQRKQESFHKLWHSDEWLKQNIQKVEKFDYEDGMKELKLFHDNHPKVMEKRIEEKNWKFDYDISLSRKKSKDKIKEFAEKYFNMDFSYKNYKLVK